MSINTTYPFTCATGTINGQPVARNYTVEAADARELHEFDDRLDVAAYRLLQAAIGSGLPVNLVTRNRDGRRERVTVIVEYAVIDRRVEGNPVAGSGNLIRVRYWGFGHNVWLADIESIATPDVEYLD
ncbi:hypothetical protein SEA_LEMOND_41 [Mycobacterium phage LeMond]|uniref:Uncharacterized protein n=1 Tax=Mycobacterium phage KiSi TaxID=2507856 RepID=A0A410TBL1_9CAUD|nr:hypothetical protein I5G98_gp067 [Mycobacterium phage KiSi]AYR01106.1 hypothetical protein SEA_LEMOND_41 [Mycobacterium phage LeMond]AYR01208.1 hypothetical protein SEA_OSCAR_41 [Mycobacterium phage Oscar]AYR01641.1 hypothetical protein SEA_SCARLETT_41 [Mycobacterium phage Scarlett]QAU06459.1 hypothetical protein SEA_KISI_41 [Mycobacterium phage KiSi]